MDQVRKGYLGSLSLTSLGLALGLAALASCAGDSDDSNYLGLGEIRTYSYEDTNGLLVFDPDDKRNDPRAGDPSYIYLLLDKEAVRLTGPSLAGQSEDLFEFRSPSVEVRIETVPEGQHAIGMDVVVNERLTYQFTIDDFEDEGSLIGSASLTLLNGTMQSEFVFAALGSPGVAHDLTIQAIIDGVPTGAATAPVTIETRYDDDACIIDSDWVDEILEPLRACSPEDVCLVLSAPGNCWHGTVNEAKQGNTETIEVEIFCPENCEVPLPVGAECHEGTCRLVH
tara:strand:- start:23058 stop:23906 length:849 start_codon:yes stop_codon:yes gene_type:complete